MANASMKKNYNSDGWGELAQFSDRKISPFQSQKILEILQLIAE